MLLDPNDARRFMATYERVAIAVHTVGKTEPDRDSSTCLASARKNLQNQPELLDQALEWLKQQNIDVDPDVIVALRQMELAEWVHVKDLRSGSIFLNQDGTDAYCTTGLTQQPATILGGRGFLVETGLCPFVGRIVCDGIFITRAQLGPGLWSSFHKRYLNLKTSGRLHRRPESAPPWQSKPEQTLEILEPWQMVPLEIADDVLAFLKATLQAHHPLQEHTLFPFLKREDRQIWILTKDDDDGTTWLLDLTKKQRLNSRRIYAFQQLKDDNELEQLIQQDHQEWLDQFADDSDV